MFCLAVLECNKDSLCLSLFTLESACKLGTVLLDVGIIVLLVRTGFEAGLRFVGVMLCFLFFKDKFLGRDERDTC